MHLRGMAAGTHMRMLAHTVLLRSSSFCSTAHGWVHALPQQGACMHPKHVMAATQRSTPHLKPSRFIVLAYALNRIMPLRNRRFWSADLGCRLCLCPGCMSRTLPVPVSLNLSLKEEYTLFLPPVNLGFRCELDCRILCVAKLLLAHMLLGLQAEGAAKHALLTPVMMCPAVVLCPALCHPCACACISKCVAFG